MHISLQIIIAALSVMGFYFCLKTIASLIFTSKLIAAAVIVDDKKQICQLNELLDDASSALFAAKRRRLAVFLPNDIWDSCNDEEKSEIWAHIDRFGAEFYII